MLQGSPHIWGGGNLIISGELFFVGINIYYSLRPQKKVCVCDNITIHLKYILIWMPGESFANLLIFSLKLSTQHEHSGTKHFNIQEIITQLVCYIKLE